MTYFESYMVLSCLHRELSIILAGLLHACSTFYLPSQEFITQVTALANKGTCVCEHEEPDEDPKKDPKDPPKTPAVKLSASATARTIQELHSAAHKLKLEGFTVGAYVDLRKRTPDVTIQAWAIVEMTETEVTLKPYELLKEHPVKKLPLDELKLYKLTTPTIPTPVTGWSSPYDNISWSWEGIKAEVLLGWGVVIGPASKQ